MTELPTQDGVMTPPIWRVLVGIWLILAGQTAWSGQLELTIPPRENFTMAAFRFWAPETISSFKGIALLSAGYNGDGRGMVTDPKWQEFAQRHQLALIASFLKGEEGNWYYDVTKGSGRAVLEAIQHFAKESKHPELETIPMVLWGHSAGGQFNFSFACWKPHRVIAFVVNKGAYYPGTPTTATRHIPALLFLGSKDTPERITNITKLFETNRRLGAPWALAAEPDAGHEQGRTREMAITFFDAILPLRQPAPSAANAFTATPQLTELKEESGWLGDLASKQVGPAAALSSKSKTSTVWLPNQTVANWWQAFVKKQPFPTDSSLPTANRH